MDIKYDKEKGKNEFIYETEKGFLNKATGSRYVAGINRDPKKSETTGYPKSTPEYIQPNSRELVPADHDFKEVNIIKNPNVKSNDKYFVPKPEGHFIRDLNSQNPNEATYPVEVEAFVPSEDYVGHNNINAQVFSGATTNINPHNDPIKDEIIKSGTLSKYLEEKNRLNEFGTYGRPPISPVHPFYRMNNIDNPFLANEAIFNTYNRTKTPIADIAFRKGFRHLFFTRPECYLTYKEGNNIGLCDQAYNDDDFSSAYTRMPHIIKLLSPVYVTGSFPKDSGIPSNWNYLLSNCAQGLNVVATTMSINENVSKSIEGFTVTPAMHMESRQGSTIDITFKDTKNLEVYETIRLWMLYMYKRKKGIFIPPYNGYLKSNSFFQVPNNGRPLSSNEYTQYHPYDRAIEYGATLFDIVTNESGTKILYWCKYYGIYPTSVSPTLSNESDSPITDMTTTVTFKYHKKLENNNISLVEFNYNAGLTDDMGKVNQGTVYDSMPYLLRDDYDFSSLKKYQGASGMFTGSPYIVMSRSHPDPTDRSNIITYPNLRFMNITNLEADAVLNLGLTNAKINTENIASL